MKTLTPSPQINQCLSTQMGGSGVGKLEKYLGRVPYFVFRYLYRYVFKIKTCRQQHMERTIQRLESHILFLPAVLLNIQTGKSMRTGIKTNWNHRSG